jgi:hypothetical protein
MQRATARRKYSLLKRLSALSRSALYTAPPEAPENGRSLPRMRRPSAAQTLRPRCCHEQARSQPRESLGHRKKGAEMCAKQTRKRASPESPSATSQTTHAKVDRGQAGGRSRQRRKDSDSERCFGHYLPTYRSAATNPAPLRCLRRGLNPARHGHFCANSHRCCRDARTSGGLPHPPPPRACPGVRACGGGRGNTGTVIVQNQGLPALRRSERPSGAVADVRQARSSTRRHSAAAGVAYTASTVICQ